MLVDKLYSNREPSNRWPWKPYQIQTGGAETTRTKARRYDAKLAVTFNRPHMRRSTYRAIFGIVAFIY